jgi:DNA polymerase-3 subunit delta'
MSFSGILGHTRETEILKSAIVSGKVPHAFLFAGPDGIGKRLVAKAFSGALNCSSGSDDACGACADCSMMESAIHPNLIEISPVDKDGEKDPQGLIRINQIREVQNSLRYRVERGMKTVIVDGADRLVPAAAHAFLKTLEEPPPGSVIILVTSKASDLLPTILSRCQRINFRPLPEEVVKGFLAGSKGLSANEAGAVARLSGGSLSKAAAFVDDGSLQKRREVIQRLSSIGPGDTAEALKFAEELSKMDGLDDLLEFMKSWYRDRIVASEGAPHLIANNDMERHLKDAGVGEFNRLCSAFWAVEEARKSIAPPRYANKQLTLEVLILKVSGAHFM